MAALRQGELAARMATLGASLLLSEPAVLAARLRREVPQWQQVAQSAGIVPE